MRNYLCFLALSASISGPVYAESPTAPSSKCGEVAATPPCNCEKPRYPIESANRNEQGKTTLQFLLTTEGRPTRIMVVRSSGYPRLDGASVAAITNACFKPIEKDGKLIEQEASIDFEWKLD
ncbi:energy transducer TonB [Niveibacterium sp. COAC-50]|uniref:energy transducer TonB n=1 Tax=Niveibacterium sp. COAC-50 TaxID=2729384 RepID=UPI001551BC01|nr:energy transducer TonB [Niveibacterium sp. COAC-50]